MMKKNLVGQLWVKIPVPAKFFTHKISILPLLYNMKIIHLRDVFRAKYMKDAPGKCQSLKKMRLVLKKDPKIILFTSTWTVFWKRLTITMSFLMTGA